MCRKTEAKRPLAKDALHVSVTSSVPRITWLAQEQVNPGPEAQQPYHGHPDAGHDVYATLGEGTDATPLALTAAQQGVEAEGEGDETGEDKEQASC